MGGLQLGNGSTSSQSFTDMYHVHGYISFLFAVCSSDKKLAGRFTSTTICSRKDGDLMELIEFVGLSESPRLQKATLSFNEEFTD